MYFQGRITISSICFEFTIHNEINYQVHIGPGPVVDGELISGLEVSVRHAGRALRVGVEVGRDFSVVVIRKIPKRNQSSDRLFNVTGRRNLNELSTIKQTVVKWDVSLIFLSWITYIT